MIDFKNIEPPTHLGYNDLEDFYLGELKLQIKQNCADLRNKDSFEIRLIDFGFAKS